MMREDEDQEDEDQEDEDQEDEDQEDEDQEDEETCFGVGWGIVHGCPGLPLLTDSALWFTLE